MFWQLPSGTYFEGLVTRIRWCYIKMVNNYVFHKVLHSEKKCYKIFIRCGALNTRDQFFKLPLQGVM